MTQLNHESRHVGAAPTTQAGASRNVNFLFGTAVERKEATPELKFVVLRDT